MRQTAVSVLLATRNRSQSLGATLSAYCRVDATVPWQMVVVDNGSTDQTRDVLQSFASRLPLEVVRHPIPGKNAALNAGLAAVRGQFVVLTDDDSLPAVDLLGAWQNCADRHPEYGLFGGRIEPRFHESVPAWLGRCSPHLQAMMFTRRDLPEGPVEAGDIYGCNMAVRAEVFRNGHRFSEAIGPNGSDPDYPMGSEVEFCRRVARTGVRCWFARSAVVEHLVLPNQWDEAAWIGRGYRLGRGRARIAFLEGRTAVPPRPGIATRLAALSPFPQLRFPALCELHIARGFRAEVEAQRIR